MTQPDSLKLDNLSYDSSTERLMVQITGWRHGQPFNVAGGLKVPTPGDLPESQVRAACKQELAAFLREVADKL